MKNYGLIPLGLCTVLFLFSCSTEKDQVTLADYERAESFLFSSTNQLVYGTVSSQSWQEDGRLIYRKSLKEGGEYVLANPIDGTKTPAFDHAKMADALSEISEREIKASELSLSGLKLSADNGTLSYRFSGKNYSTDLSTFEITLADRQSSFPESLSPDGKLAAYTKENNLWVRDTKTDKHTQLTFDGIEDYGYATNNAGWVRGRSSVLLWSPQSDKIATFRHDGRGVGEMYLYDTRVGHSKLDVWKYPLPGDSLIFRIERMVIHLEPKPKMVKLKMPQDPHRSTTSDHVAGRGGKFLDVEWNVDGSLLSFVSSSRDHKVAHLKVADPNTGVVRSVMREEMATYYEGGFSDANWRVLPSTNEVIWFSEKSNWGHLYLHDLETGQLKNQITEGEWAVLDVCKVDEENRTIYFRGSNREEGDPYFHYLYKVNFDGSGLTLLTPENAHHSVSWPISKDSFTDTYSTPDTPAKSVVRNLDGKVLMDLEEEDISELLANGWVAPIPFTTKARDNETDLYGLMYKPSNFDESKKYPVLNYLYPGPQSGSVGSRSFRPSRSDKQAVAELGFIVVEVDAMGSPGRSKSFHDAYYGNMGDNGLPDQVTTIQQLGARHSWMDLDRIGIWGHSGGGFASTGGILRYPDFYKVAVSGSGNHDNRNYEDDWGEKWQGLLVNNPTAEAGDGQAINLEVVDEEIKTNYDNQANQLQAANLKGKLLLGHGMLDDNVPPTNTMLVVEALMEANKDFDLLLLPNQRHGYGKYGRYWTKKRWDYFVRHLKGIEPVSDFVIGDN